jgi:hypothetical protein
MLQIINNNEDYTGKTFDSVLKFLNWKAPQLVNINENILIVVGYNEGKTIFEIKQQYPNYKIIIYQLEQLFGYQSLWFNPKSTSSMVINRTKHIKNWLDNVDEIWDYDLDNIEFLNSLGYSNIKHLPLEICNSVKFENNQLYKEYDIVFFGCINKKRYDILTILDKKYNLLVICNQKYLEKNGFKFKNCISFCYGQELYNFIFKAKIAINLHYYDTNIQEQVRLFELLSNDVEILSEKSKRNYLNVKEFNNIDELCNMIDEKLNNIKIGISYSTFYGLEFLEKYIPTFRNKVDYIVVVHQEISFYNNPEPIQNKEILKRLLDNKLIDDIYYYKNRGKGESEMIAKRNIGLELCKKNKCDYIIPLDSDENYDFDSLISEIKFATKNNIQTLYSPIRTFYYNENFYYDDCFYVPSAYKIDERLFGYSKTEVIVDPYRKMLEKNYMITSTPMLHYNYLLETYENKINDKIACPSNETKIIYNYLKTWTSDKPAMVFQLSGNKRIIGKQNLKSLIQNKFGYTSIIEIKNNQVVKKIKSSLSQYKINGLELFEREIFWLKKLEKHNISPKIISTDKNTLSIIMEYCGETPVKTDFESQNIQIQLLNILRILMENHCYYNDFKLNNFTIKNNKLYIIDFGWCPVIKEDFTCVNTIVSNLKEKPHKNIFELFDIFNQQLNEIKLSNIKYKNNVIPNVIPNQTSNIVNNYLTEKEYFQKIEEHKKINPEHWVTNSNNDTYQKRWEYHQNTIDLCKSINPKNIIEAGTMGILINKNSDTIDLDLPTKGWRLTYVPTYNHDLTKFPWANIKDKQYDCFIALRVFHHMKTEQEKYLTEMFRISNNVILALPQLVVNIYKNICLPTKEIKSINSDTTIIFYDKNTIENFKQLKIEKPKIISKLDNSKLKINNNPKNNDMKKSITFLCYHKNNDLSQEIIQKTLQSIKSQSCKNIEIKILQSSLDKLLNLVNNNQITTDYFSFLAFGDILEKNYCEKMLSIASENDSIIYGNTQIFNDSEILKTYLNVDRKENSWILPIEYNCIFKSINIKFVENSLSNLIDLTYEYSKIGNIIKCTSNKFIYKPNFEKLNKTESIRKKVKMTIGLIYSGRIENYFPIWMESLINDIQILNNFPELIIVNNSNQFLDVSEYQKYFDNISIISGFGNIDKNISKEEYKFQLATMLADSYNIILEKAIGELIHLREDDITSANNSFNKLYNFITEENNLQKKLLGVCGIYMNRYNTNVDKFINRVIPETQPQFTNIEYTGTGYIIFWKEIAPYFNANESKTKAHDWSWCDEIYKNGNHILMDLSSKVKHWLSIDKYIQHKNEDITPQLTYSKKNRY